MISKLFFKPKEKRDLFKASKDVVFFYKTYLKTEFELDGTDLESLVEMQRNRNCYFPTVFQRDKQNVIFSIFLSWYTIFHPRKTSIIATKNVTESKNILEVYYSVMDVIQKNFPEKFVPVFKSKNRTSCSLDNESGILISTYQNTFALKGRIIDLSYISTNHGLTVDEQQKLFEFLSELQIHHGYHLPSSGEFPRIIQAKIVDLPNSIGGQEQ